MTAIEIIGTGKRTRYTVKAVTETGTNPTNGKAYRTEDAARRTAAFLLSPARFSMESCAVLSDIESRIVSAGFLTWDQVEQIEEEATA